MNESERLAAELERTLNGEAWHGPSWRELLDGITPELALARPVPGAHSIAEVVRHAATWYGIVRRRVDGENPKVTDDMDWASAATPQAWAGAVDDLFSAGESLRLTIASFPPERLHQPRPGIEMTWFHLISGSLQHGLYHAGQIPILKKAAVKA